MMKKASLRIGSSRGSGAALAPEGRRALASVFVAVAVAGGLTLVSAVPASAVVTNTNITPGGLAAFCRGHGGVMLDPRVCVLPSGQTFVCRSNGACYLTNRVSTPAVGPTQPSEVTPITTAG